MTVTISSDVLRAAGQAACYDIYDPNCQTPGLWPHLNRIGTSVIGMRPCAGAYLIACQGTELQEFDNAGNEKKFTLDGWLEDFDILPTQHPILGTIATGFYRNMPGACGWIQSILPAGATVIVTGHSKGGAEASILAPLLQLAGFDVESIILFAPANAGCSALERYYAEHLPNTVAFRNMGSRGIIGDPVPLVPSAPYRPVMPHLGVNYPPGGLLDMFSTTWHRRQLYGQAVGIPANYNA